MKVISFLIVLRCIETYFFTSSFRCNELCVLTDLIWWKRDLFKVMTCRTAFKRSNICESLWHYNPLRASLANRQLVSRPLIRRQRRTIIQPLYWWFAVSTSRLPPVVGFIDRDYCYKSVATQIPPDAGLAPILNIVRKFILSGIEPAPHPLVRVQSSVP